jgi:microsomal dipeptidase-like Zn-dependent dipeptidase
MSHFTTVQTKIKDVVVLKQALTDLGYQFTEAKVDQKVHVLGYRMQKADADIAIHASKTYDIGIKVGAEGVAFVADWWGVETTRGVTEGEFTKAVTRRYSYLKVLQELRKKGYTYEETEEKEQIHLKVTTWS